MERITRPVSSPSLVTKFGLIPPAYVKPFVEPHTIQLLQRLGYETLSFRSKSWNEFARLGAPALDSKEANMDNTTLLIIIILVVILLGGGWYGRGRWF